MTMPPRRRADDRGHLEHDRVERQRVGQVLARDEIGNERLARRQIEGSGGGARRGDRVDRPRGVEPAPGQDGERGRQRRHHRLGDQHQLPPVVDVGGHAAHQREEHDRNDPHQPDQPERQRAAVVRHEQRDVPQDRGRLHQAAGERDQQAEPEQAEVAMPESREQSVKRYQILTGARPGRCSRPTPTRGCCRSRRGGRSSSPPPRSPSTRWRRSAHCRSA